MLHQTCVEREKNNYRMIRRIQNKRWKDDGMNEYESRFCYLYCWILVCKRIILENLERNKNHIHFASFGDEFFLILLLLPTDDVQRYLVHLLRCQMLCIFFNMITPKPIVMLFDVVVAVVVMLSMWNQSLPSIDIYLPWQWDVLARIIRASVHCFFRSSPDCLLESLVAF